MKRFYSLILILVLVTHGTYAGIEGYQVTRDVTPGNFVPINGTPITIQAGSAANGLSTDIAIGFPFVYDGIAYDSLKLSTNGYLLLGSNAAVGTNINDLDGGATSNLHKPVLAPLWDPWALGTADSLTYETNGSVFTANWKNVVHASGLGGAQNFQVKLHADGTIEFIYGSTNPHTSHSYSIGINDPIGGSRHFLSLQVSGSTNFSSTTANDTLNSLPALNERYIFTPPTPLSVSSIGVPSAGYSTLKMVFDTLRTYGISQAVDIVLTADITETATVDMDFVPGCFANPITIKLNPSVSVMRLSGSIASAPLVRLRGIRNVTIDGAANGSGTARGLTIENTSATGTAAIQLTEGTHGATIANAILKTNNPGGATTTSGVIWIADANTCSQPTRLGILGTNSYNTISNCEITGGTGGRPTNGVLIYAVNGHKDSSNVIGSNVIREFGGSGTSIVGIRLTGGSFGTMLSGNTLYMTSAASAATTLNGIRIDAATSDSVVHTRIEGNSIYDLSTSSGALSTIAGILQNGTSTVGNQLVNNFINLAPGSFGGAGSNLRGISHQGGQLFVYFNTVRLAGSGSNDTSFAFIRTSAGTLNLRDNILYNGRSGSSRPQYAVGLNSTTGLTINYNDYNADGTNGVLGRLGSNRATLAAWKTATGQDGSSISEKPNFVSTTDLHINPVIYSNIASGSTTLTGFTADIDGETRHATKPDMGADEFNSAPYLTNALPDTTLDEDFGRIFLRKLTHHFADQDDAALTYSATALAAGVTPQVSNDSLYLTSVANFFGSVQVRVTAGDGANTTADTLHATVNAVPDLPVVVAPLRDTTFSEDFGKVFVSVLSNVFDDPDGNPLSYTSDTLQSGLSTQISNDSLYVLSGPEFSGTVSVRATADNGSASVSDTLFITVTSVNDAPVLAAALADTTYGEDFGRRMVAYLPPHFSDVDNGTLTYASAALGSGVTTQISGDSLYIQSEPDFNGSVAIRVAASDGLGSVADTFNLVATPVNDIPSAANLSKSTDEDQSVPIALSGSDVDGDTLTFSVVGGPSHGGLSGSGQNLTYTPALNFAGQDTFTYRANDGTANSPDATVVITVVPVNDPPTVSAALRDTTYSEDFDRTFVRRLTEVFADIDNGSLSYAVNVLGSGVAADVSNDSLYAACGLNFNGNVSLRVTASDGSLSVADTFAIIVTPVNDGPYVTSAQSDLLRTEDFGKSYAGMLTSVFADVDNGTLSYGASNLSAGVTPLISNDSLYVLSTPDFIGGVDIRLTASDGSLSAADTFAVTVSAQNDAPFIAAALRDTSYAEDFGRVFVRNLAEVFSDVDSGTLGYSVSALGGGLTANISNDSLYVNSVLNFNGPVEIRVAASDGSLSVADTFAVTVMPVNDGPVVTNAPNDVILSEDFGTSYVGMLTSIFSDIDNATLTYDAVNLSAGVTPLISNDSLYVLSAPDFIGGVDIRLTAGDGNLSVADTFVVTVTAENDAPYIAAALRDTTYGEDFGRTFVRRLTEVFADIDNGSLSYAVNVFGSGAVADVSNDSLYAAGGLNFNGTVNLRVVASDGSLSVADTFAITVTPVNDAPSAFALLEPGDGDSLTTISEPVAFKWSAASDVDGDLLTYMLHVYHASFDTVVGGISDTAYSFNLGTRLVSNTTYNWSVMVGDGQLTAAALDTFTFRTPVIVGVGDPVVNPKIVALHQNYPNPFNPTTTIRYDLVEQSRVVLKIYNLLGQEVRTLVDQVQGSGFKTVVWDGRNSVGHAVTAGLYIYRMQAGRFVTSRKMLLVK